jgi:hypothetical protein
VVALAANPVSLRPGETVQQEFEISVAPDSVAPGVNHFQMAGRALPDGTKDEFDMTFITPTTGAGRKD